MGHDAPMTVNPDGTRVMIATREELEINNVPLNFRDYCAHLLIPLNKCRVKEYYLPWKCGDERHAYEQCQYDEMKKKNDLVKEKAEAHAAAALAKQQPHSTEEY
ncbi:hypothetical protein PPL_08064 [Heterostelium album PN500]|uniref:NADH dehydrogenase [ubiquinone] 1 beta subcomplex subunit 7 n=1 Tax=Heterostelium pallidum (strain ATCC 26659 / Pp 5 / PN500) TaxID=670386 RepID=D3BII5_HETP5|nr:hypothetical protein PPL_08064 [Heterostelium album PN500]EFA78609.1 hypothetical protein PPL_08064 [Heterostelium album PN500]|eukprot:XP_020430733.1 hypothetical protein PPL_08064 [Heterostelium album PN500]